VHFSEQKEHHLITIIIAIVYESSNRIITKRENLLCSVRGKTGLVISPTIPSLVVPSNFQWLFF